MLLPQARQLLLPKHPQVLQLNKAEFHHATSAFKDKRKFLSRLLNDGLARSNLHQLR